MIRRFTILGTDDHPGILYRSIQKLFSAKKTLERRRTGNNDYRVQISVRLLEIYNELVSVKKLFEPK